MLNSICVLSLCLLILPAKSVYSSQSCSRNFSKASGSIDSRGSMMEYGDYRICNYAIKVRPEKQVSMDFVEFPRNNFEDFLVEYVVIFDGPDCLAPRIGVAHGQQALKIVSSGNHLTALFCSNLLRGAGQFKAVYSTVSGQERTEPVSPGNNSRIIDNCGGELNETSGMLNYRGDEKTNALCIWKIKVTDGGKVQVGFTKIILGANNAWLRVLDGGNCGAPVITLVNQTVTDAYLEFNSTSNTMILVYASSSGSERAHIEASYWEVLAQKPVPSFPSDSVTQTEEMANNPAVSIKFCLTANSVGYAIGGTILLLIAIL